MKSLRVIYHYPEDDKKFSSDCLEVSFIVDGKMTSVEEVSREDYPYNEAKCFVAGVRLAAPFCSITEEEVADIEC